jgi:hypothetical protein
MIEHLIELEWVVHMLTEIRSWLDESYLLRPFKTEGEKLLGVDDWQNPGHTETECFEKMRNYTSIGVLLGTPGTNGVLICLDVDSDEIEAKIKNTTELMATRKEFGSKGAHYFFYIENPIRHFELVDAKGNTLEIRCLSRSKGTPQTVLLAPGLHKSGKPYTVLQDREPLIISNQKLQGLLEKISNIADLQPKKNETTEPLLAQGKVVEGNRNNSLFKEACVLVERGSSREFILATLRVFNSQNCKPPLSEQELGSIVESASTRTKPIQEVKPIKKTPEKTIAWASDMLGKEPEPVEYVVDKLIPKASLVLLDARAAQFKTSIAISAAIAVTRGIPAFSFLPTKKGVVGILDGESGPWLMPRYLKMLGANTDDKIVILEMPQYDLGKKEDVLFIENFIAENNIVLLIADSLRRLSNGDENDSSTQSGTLTTLKTIANHTGCAIELIHHERKRDRGETVTEEDDMLERIRGSSDIAAAVDVVLQLKRQPKSEMVEIHITKNRYGPDGDVYTLERKQTGQDSAGNPLFEFTGSAGGIEKTSPIIEQLFLWLHKNMAETTSTGEIKSILCPPYSEKTVENLVADLKNEGTLLPGNKRGVHRPDYPKIIDFLKKHQLVDGAGKLSDKNQKTL